VVISDISSTFRIFAGMEAQQSTQKMSSCAMRSRASLIGRTVRPKGPAAVHRSFQADQWSTSKLLSRPVGGRRSGQGVVERVAAIAAAAGDGTSWEVEALNTLADVVGHGWHCRSRDECVSPLAAAAVSARDADHASARLAIRVQVDPTNVVSIHRTHPGAAASHSGLTPPILAGWLSAFRDCFTAPVWAHVLVLVAGAVLALGKRTVSQALRVVGLAERPGFARYRDVLSRARWNGRAVARTLLAQALNAFPSTGEVVIGVDDAIERRWGPEITARGIYRGPVRSSRGHFVRASGLRWLSLMAMVPIPWANRRWALPFLTILAPSKRWSGEHSRRHKTVVEWAKLAKVPGA